MRASDKNRRKHSRYTDTGPLYKWVALILLLLSGSGLIAVIGAGIKKIYTLFW